MKNRLIISIYILLLGSLLFLNNRSYYYNFKSDPKMLDAIVLEVKSFSFFRYSEIEINGNKYYAEVLPYSFFTPSKDNKVKVKYYIDSDIYKICPSYSDYLSHNFIICLLISFFLFLVFAFSKFSD